MALDRYGHLNRIKVVLDTNALMMPVQFGVDLFGDLCDLFGGYDALILDEVMHELCGLARGRGNKATAARFGLTVAARCTVLPPCKYHTTVDDKIIQVAEMLNATVVTNDKELKSRLLNLHIPVVTLRSCCRLELIRK